MLRLNTVKNKIKRRLKQVCAFLMSTHTRLGVVGVLWCVLVVMVRCLLGGHGAALLWQYARGVIERIVAEHLILGRLTMYKVVSAPCMGNGAH